MTHPDKLRAEGKVRRSVVEGLKVRFQRLDPYCRATAIWLPRWVECFPNKAKAVAAAQQWEKKGTIASRFLNHSGAKLKPEG